MYVGEDLAVRQSGDLSQHNTTLGQAGGVELGGSLVGEERVGGGEVSSGQAGWRGGARHI